MEHTLLYADLVKRNQGYIAEEAQKRLSETTLLIAGCGMGSAPAICAARTGFRKFVLVDGDVIEAHNLNRQFYDFADVGQPKVDALKRHILAINPEAQVEVWRVNLDRNNTADIVAKCDIVFDTVDFIDLPALLGLHEEALRQKKPLFTAISVGFGGLVWFIPPGSTVTWPSLVAEEAQKLAAAGGDPHSFGEVYRVFVGRLSPFLDQEVLAVFDAIFESLKAGRPCPAPQLAVGSFSVAALALTMVHDYLAGRPVVSSPELVVQSYRSLQTRVVSL